MGISIQVAACQMDATDAYKDNREP
jgi:hypothetical protein